MGARATEITARVAPYTLQSAGEAHNRQCRAAALPMRPRMSPIQLHAPLRARSHGILLSLLLLTGALSTHRVGAQAPAPPPTAPGAVQAEADGRITIEADGVPLGKLLHDLAAQAHWDLALSAPDSMLQTPITLRVKDRSGEEVLESLRAVSGLSLDLQGGFLTASVPGSGQDGRREGKKRKRKYGAEDRVLVGQPVTIQAHETVGDAVAIAAPLRVEGHVRGDAVAVGSTLALAPSAVVDGDAVAVGGSITVEPGAQLNGSQVSVPNPVGGLTRWLADPQHNASNWHDAGKKFPSGLFTLFRGLCLLLLGVLLVSFVPQRIHVIVATMNARPWLSLLFGFCLLLGLLPVCILLGITLIGIPLIPVAIAVVLALLWVGATAISSRIGGGLPRSDGRSLLLNFVIGAVLITLVDLIPWFGTPLVLTLSMIGAGATMISRLGTRSPAPPDPPPATTPVPDPLPG